jgi:hypothetical protein
MWLEKIMVKSLDDEKDEINKEFYVNCLTYFDTLRKSGKSDDVFEDEYFFTLPAVSGSGLDY